MLILTVPYYREYGNDLLTSKYGVLYCFSVIVISVLGSVGTSIMSYSIIQKSNRKIKWHGRVFIGMLYLGAFISNLTLTGVIFNHLMFRLDNGFVSRIWILYLIITFPLLILEIHFLQYPPKIALPRILVKPAEFISKFYIGIGINICWVHLVVANPIHQTNIFASIVTHAILMIIFAFSFERLFWYEVISDSDSKKSYVRTFLAILAVLISGILPIYLA
jgi:hypothetical protein